MKTVYLIRHAKSDWSNGLLTDFERPLNKRGKRDAPFMATKLKEMDVSPDIVISSTANRAIITARAIAEGLSYDESEIVQRDELYHAGTETMLNEIELLSNEINVVCLVGHNPGMTMLSNYLTGDYIDNIVTTGIVRIDFDIDSWQEIIQGSGTKVFYIYPKMYLQ